MEQQKILMDVTESDFKKMMQAKDQPKIEYFKRKDYTFHENFKRKILCKDKTTTNGRTYLTPEGNSYASITTMLGKSKSEKSKKILETWKNNVGHEKAAKITKAAAERGTALHTLVEDFLRAAGETEFPIVGNKNGKLFKQIHPYLSRIGDIHVIEQPLYSDILKVAGRVDLIAEFDNKLSVIDFKSSTKEKRESWIEDYLIQETFYSVAFGALFPQRIEQIVTIMAVEETGEPQIFIKKPGDYLEALVTRVKKYYAEN